MYFIELFWIAQTYSFLALMLTYIFYLIIEMRLKKVARENDIEAKFE